MSVRLHRLVLLDKLVRPHVPGRLRVLVRPYVLVQHSAPIVAEWSRALHWGDPVHTLWVRTCDGLPGSIWSLDA